MGEVGKDMERQAGTRADRWDRWIQVGIGEDWGREGDRFMSGSKDEERHNLYYRGVTELQPRRGELVLIHGSALLKHSN